MARGKAKARDRLDVVIAGGGLVGRTLALALVKLAPQGFRIALVDAEPAQPKDGGVDARALALSAATKNLLAALDLWPLLAPKAQTIDMIEITDSALNAALGPIFSASATSSRLTAPSPSWSSMASYSACSPMPWPTSPPSRCIRRTA